MSIYSKRILFFVICLCAVLFIVIAQIGKKGGQPYTTSCSSKEDRCNKCRIYQYEMKKLQNPINEKEYDDSIKMELAWIKEHCGRDTCPCPQMPLCKCPTDSCRNKRNFSYRIESDGRLIFCIRRNEFKNGKCEPSKEKPTDILEINNSPIINYSRYNRKWESEFVSYYPAADINMPFKFLEYDEKWVNESYDTSYPDSSFAFLFPDSASNFVYLIKPEKVGSKKGVIKPLLGIDPKWFSYYDEKKDADLEFVFEDLLTIFAHDPDAKVIRVIDTSSIKKLIISVKGTYKGKQFFLTTGYSEGKYLGLYNPFKFNGTDEQIKAIINKLVGTDIDYRIDKMVLNFSLGEKKEKILAVLPSSFSGRPTPKYSIGNPESSDCLTQEIKEKISSISEPVDLLVEDGGYYSWKNGAPSKQEVAWLNKSVNYSLRNYCQILSLGIIDANLKIVTWHKVDSVTTKIIFFFQNSTRKLYCWTIKNGKLTENDVLTDETIFQLTGIPVISYLNKLKEGSATKEEKDFFIQHSDRNTFELLDGFNLENPNERVILWTSDHQPYLVKNVLQANAKKFGAIANETRLTFLVSDSKTKSWATFQARYSKEKWIREKIISIIVDSKNEITPIDLWLGSGNRFGMCRYKGSSKFATVYLDNQHRKVYGEKAFSEIYSLIDEDKIIYQNGNQPTDLEFFESCLKPDWNNWNKEVWRANPLGYFDRKTAIKNR